MSGGKYSFSMTVNGEPVHAQKTMDVVNPSHGRAFAKAPVASAADLDQAVAAAKAAFPKWRATAADERIALVGRAADVISQHADELAQIFTREHGRPLAGAKEEILGAGYWMKALSKYKLPVEVTEDSPSRRIEVHHEPLGVIAAIVPWNFPVLLAAWKITHSVLTGNVIVLKPSPFTPLTTLRVGELLRGVFPAGVVNIISGSDELGPMMTSHPGFAKISFTGSSATGKRIMESAARDLKRITLELGGNDAAIILPDVDLDDVAQKIFYGAFYNSGQVCVATKRLYVHDKIYEDLRARFQSLAQSTKVGDGLEPGSIFGPVQNRQQFLRVQNLVRDARDTGLAVLDGGPVPQGDGYFVPLTLVDNPPDTSRVVVEEAFGPVLPLLRFRDVDEVIERANNTPYGLAGAVWSKDIDRAVDIAHRLDTGTVWINQNLQSSPGTPLGGHKQSGIGVENGAAGLLEFTQVKAIYIPKSAPAA
jgi:acyl-CoA reductase-like NAD-dependent aldehyde dehydrogenase